VQKKKLNFQWYLSTRADDAPGVRIILTIAMFLAQWAHVVTVRSRYSSVLYNDGVIYP
jgi:hypothetical protein